MLLKAPLIKPESSELSSSGPPYTIKRQCFKSGY